MLKVGFNLLLPVGASLNRSNRQRKDDLRAIQKIWSQYRAPFKRERSKSVNHLTLNILRELPGSWSTENRLKNPKSRPYNSRQKGSHLGMVSNFIQKKISNWIKKLRKVNILHIRALVKADAVILFDTYGSADSRLHSVFLYHLEVSITNSTGATSLILPISTTWKLKALDLHTSFGTLI